MLPDERGHVAHLSISAANTEFALASTMQGGTSPKMIRDSTSIKSRQRAQNSRPSVAHVIENWKIKTGSSNPNGVVKGHSTKNCASLCLGIGIVDNRPVSRTSLIWGAEAGNDSQCVFYSTQIENWNAPFYLYEVLHNVENRLSQVFLPTWSSGPHHPQAAALRQFRESAKKNSLHINVLIVPLRSSWLPGL